LEEEESRTSLGAEHGVATHLAMDSGGNLKPSLGRRHKDRTSFYRAP
jgi:hypothetical protein